jgi:hypothetical protein
MGQADKQSTPKYMCMKANTQFELAQSIDDALAQAEQQVQKDHHQACLHIWIEQLLDGLNEEFSVELDVSGIQTLDGMQDAILTLLPSCKTFYQATQGEKATLEGFRLILTKVMERCFLNALDMMHARGIWRFDIQRNMQVKQGTFMHAIQETTF